MATATTGYSWTSGETVTPEKLNDIVNKAVITVEPSEITASKIADGNVTNAKFAGSVGLNPWTTKTGIYTAVAGDRIVANTTSGAFTVTLPASPTTYDEVSFADHYDKWATNNLTIARNGSNINGAAENLTCEQSGGKQITLRYEGSTIGWRIYV